MKRKLIVACMALLGTISVVYATNREMAAVSSSTNKYYDYTESIHYTKNSKFKMGGLDWWILYADQNTGVGYIVADNVIKGNCTAGTAINGYAIYQNEVDNCMANVQAKYATGADDDIGTWIKNINNSAVSNLKVPTSDEYWEITKQESDLERFSTPNGSTVANFIWLESTTMSSTNAYYKRVLYRNKSLATPAYTALGRTYNYLQEWDNLNTCAKLNPVFKISLPQKNYLKKATLTMDKTSYKYADTDIQPQTPFIEIGVKEGEGPYEFSLESGSTQLGDLDKDGTQMEVGKTLSSNFEIVNVNSSTGTAEIQVKAGSKLTVGDYYLKVKVKDTSTNKSLYLKENDTYRTQDVSVKISITKSDQGDIKLYDDALKTNEVTEITKDGSANAFFIYPDGGASDIANTNFKYEIESGSTILTSLDATGDKSKIELSGVVGEAVIKITKPGGANYNDKTVKLKIKVTPSFGITYAPDYGSYAKSVYEYNQNVFGGDTIGKITYSNGISPYTFELTPDTTGFPADTDSYKNFEIDGLDSANATTNASPNPLIVNIKSGAPDLNSDTNSLKAGDYHFCIVAYDKNGNPVDANGNKKIKDCHTVTVNKTTPTIAFDNNSAIKMKIGGSAFEGSITTTNKDIGKTKPNSSDIWKPSYELKDGVANVLKPVEVTGTDYKNYKVDFMASPNTTSLPKDFNLVLTLPETENYVAVSKNADGNDIGKKITVYKQLSGLTWTGKSSYATNDVISGKSIGELLAKDGLADFTYELADASDASITSTDGSSYSATDAADNGNFKIDTPVLNQTTKAVVKTKTNLSKKTDGYKVQFKVTDSNNDVVFVSAVIVVNAENQGTVRFKDANGNNITSMDIYFDDINSNTKYVSAYVDGDKPSVEKITYQIAPDAEQAGGIKGTDYLEVGLSNGELIPKDVGTVVVKAKSEGDSTYADAYGSITINIKPAERTIAFDITGNTRRIQKDATNVKEVATVTKAQSTDTITYTSKDQNVFTIDNNGNITIVGTGTAKLIASVTDSTGHYKSVSCEKEITIYDGASGSFTQTTNPQAGTESANINKPVGGVSATGGIGTITYKMNTTYTGNNIDGALFKVDETYGTLSFNAAITASDLVGKYNTTKKAYILKAQVNVLDDGVLSSTVDCEILIKGEALTNVKFDGEVNGTLTHTYSKNGSFTLSLVGNDGKGLPAYSLKNDPNGMSDVIKAITGNTAFIENANDPDTSLNKPIIIAKIPPAGGYDEAEIEVEVSIVKAKQANFAFVQNEISILPGGKVTPTFKGAETAGAIKLVSQNTGFVTIENDNTIKGEAIGKAEVIASIEGDRNYEPGSAKATVTVTDKPSYVFIISVPSATYGDTGLQASIVKSEHTSGATLTKKWESSDPSVATINETTGEITIVGAGETSITCTQTSTLDDTVKTSGTLNVKKRPISIAYENKEIYVGEAMPSFTLNSTLESGTLVNGDTISSFPIPAGATSTAGDTLTKGEYTISGSYDTNESKEAVIKNYAVTFIDGILTIKQDTPKDSWYELQDDAGNVLSSDNWYNHDVNVVLKNAAGDAGTYDQISDTTFFNDSDLTKYKVNKEDDNLKDVYFRIDPASAVDHAGAISEKTQTHVKIDKTPPIITSLTGEEVNQNLLARVVNTITFGRYMKPGTQVEVKANDQPKGTSTISGLKEIEYTIYSVDEDGNVDIQNPYDTDTINASETTKLPILSNGKYEVCAVAYDHAGNPSQEKCTKLWLKPIGEDSDGDGIPDINIDTDGDSIPDLNITKNPGDKIPWLNIDTDGDGKPDMNIDLDGDGTPDLNTGIITKWICDKMGDMDDDGDPDYKTSSTVKGINNIDTNGNNIPDLNIDLDLDGLPELNINIDGDLKQAQTNIDGNGGGKANINIDTNGDGTPEQNVISVPEWNPDHKVYKDGKIIYETMDLEFKPIEELEDNGVVVKPKDEHVSISPDMKLDVNNITSSTSEAEKEEIRLRSGLKNSEVKQVYNVNLLEENKIIQPNGKVEVKIPIDTSIKNPRIMMKAKDGTWQMMEAKAEGNYYVFETDYIGDVSVLGDQEATADDPTNNDDKTEDPKDDTKTPTPTDTSKNPDTSVKGTYTKGTNTIGMGGALTGDSTNIMLYVGIAGLALIMLIIASRRRHKE